MAAAWNRVSRPAEDRQRHLGRLRHFRTNSAHDAAVGRARRRRLSRHPSGGTGGIIIASSILTGARPRAGGPRHRQLARLRRGAPELAAPGANCWSCCQPSAPSCHCRQPRATLAVENGQRRRRRRRKSCSVAGRQLLSEGRQGAGHHRRRARSGKSSLARALVGVWRPCARHRPARRRGDGAMVLRSARAAHRLSAAGRRAVRGQRSPKTLRDLAPKPAAEAVIAAANAAGMHELIVRLPEGYETQIGEQGAAALGWPTAADRAGSRALRRPLPGCSRRAELKSRCRGRRGADPRRSSGCGLAAASSSDRRASVRACSAAVDHVLTCCQWQATGVRAARRGACRWCRREPPAAAFKVVPAIRQRST